MATATELLTAALDAAREELAATTAELDAITARMAADKLARADAMTRRDALAAAIYDMERAVGTRPRRVRVARADATPAEPIAGATPEPADDATPAEDEPPNKPRRE